MEEILDGILKFLKTYVSIPFTNKELYNDMNSRPSNIYFRPEIQEGDLVNYLEYLLDKKYLDLYSNSINKGREYKLNFRGKIFIQTGGFTREKELEDNFRQSTLDTNQSVRITNKMQIGALIISGLIALMACIFQGLSYRTEKGQEEQIRFLQKQIDSIKSFQKPTMVKRIYLYKDSSKLSK